jgi:hypothetical protein
MRLLPALAGFLDQYVFGHDRAAPLAAFQDKTPPCIRSTTEPESTTITGGDPPTGVALTRFRDHCDAGGD